MSISVEELFELIKTQQEHIQIQNRIIKHIQNEIKLANVSYKQNDYDEMKYINDEIIEFIDKLMVEEYDLQDLQRNE